MPGSAESWVIEAYRQIERGEKITIEIQVVLTAIILVVQIFIARDQSKIEECLKRQELKERKETAQLNIPEWAERVIDEYMTNSDLNKRQ